MIERLTDGHKLVRYIKSCCANDALSATRMPFQKCCSVIDLSTVSALPPLPSPTRAWAVLSLASTPLDLPFFRLLVDSDALLEMSCFASSETPGALLKYL